MSERDWKVWIRNDRDRAAVARGCTFDRGAARKVIRFFSTYLKHSKGRWAGQPFRLLRWQIRDIIAPLFGWKRADGSRRFRRAYIEIAKKNGKSTLAAGVGLCLLGADGEAGAEVYSCATKRDQAEIVHGEAVRMVQKSRALATAFKVNLSTRVISYPAADAKYAALASDSAGTEGINPHALIKDEVHAWTDRAFADTLRYATIARRQPLDFMITTAGVRDPESVGWQEHEYAVKVRDGIIEDDEYFVYIRAAAPEDDLADPEVQRKANPSYGVTIDPAEIAKAVQDAKARPSELSTLQRYRFNIWVNQVNRAIDMAKWEVCGRVSVPWSELEHGPVFAGLDLSSKLDLTAFVIAAPWQDGYAVRPQFFAPETRAYERQRKDNVPYLQWAEEGYLTLTPGETIDYGFVRNAVVDASKLYDLREVAFDPWAANQLAHQLQDDDGITMVEMRQGFGSLSEPTKQFEALYVAGKLYHENNPVLRWMASNLAFRRDPADNIKPDKEASSDRIDGCVATIMALGRAILQPSYTSVYETRGVLTL